ncbi:MAG: hypothetical protein U0835_24415 [Isosphaeraceae bacterium]
MEPAMRADEQTRGRQVVISHSAEGRRLVRLDSPFAPPPGPGDRPTGTPESGGLLDLIRKAIQASTRERRGAVRHDAVERDIWVGWWTGEHFGAVQGRLVNISRSGALIVMGSKPPKRQPIWLYKEVGEALACVRAEVVGVTPAPSSEYTSRFRFAVPCPTILCQAAVCGQGDASRGSKGGKAHQRG